MHDLGGQLVREGCLNIGTIKVLKMESRHLVTSSDI